MSKLRIFFLAPAGATHDHHGYLNEMAASPDVELTVLISPFWAFDHKGTSMWNSLFHKFRKIYADRFYDKPRKYRLIKKAPVFVGKSYHFYPGLHKILFKLKPDVIHINFEPWNVLVAQIILWRNLFSKKTKIILFSHDNIYRPYRNRFFYNLLIYKGIEDYNMKYLDGSTAVTHEVKDLLYRKGLKGPVAIVGDHVDVSVYKKKKVQDLKRKLGLNNCNVIGYFSRIEKAKGIFTLIDALAMIKDENFKLLLVGGVIIILKILFLRELKKMVFLIKLFLLQKDLGKRL